MSVFLTSDCHFNHDKEFIWKARGFNNVQEMNEAIVSHWNLIVQPEDDVYLLGDVMLGDASSIEFLKRLNGKIHIVYGNHDTSNRKKMYNKCTNVVECADALSFKYRKYHFYLSHYPTITTNGEIQGLRQVTINFYGHTHQTTNFYDDIPWIYHVGMDSHNCCPINIDDTIEEMCHKFEEYKLSKNLEN